MRMFLPPSGLPGGSPGGIAQSANTSMAVTAPTILPMPAPPWDATGDQPVIAEPGQKGVAGKIDKRLQAAVSGRVRIEVWLTDATPAILAKLAELASNRTAHQPSRRSGPAGSTPAG